MNGVPVREPLSPRDVERLRMGRRAINEANALLQKCCDCGWDCRAYQALSDALAARIDLALQHFAGQVKE